MTTLSIGQLFTSNQGVIANGDFHQEFLDACSKISPHDIYRVPVRNGEMITSCEPRRCYWNANLIAQTFGGEVVYGYIIEDVSNHCEGSIRLMGHAVWLNPEGKFVDVTPTKNALETHRYFLPTDVKLVLNDTVTEQMKTLTFIGGEDSIRFAFECAVFPNKEWLQFSNLGTGITNEFFRSIKWCQEHTPEGEYAKFKNKIVEVNAWPQEWVLNLMNQVLSTHKVDLSNSPVETEGDYIELFAQTMDPLIQEVDSVDVPLELFDGRLNFNDFFWPIHFKILGTDQTIFEASGGYDIPKMCAYKRKEDSTFDNDLITSTPVIHKSRVSKKSIADYVPVSLKTVQLPSKKSKRRKLLKIAQRYGLTHEEVLVLSDPHLYPHPYIVQNNGIGTTLKSFSRL